MRKSLHKFDLLVRCLIFLYRETNKPKKPCDSPSNTDFGDCPHAVIWHKRDVLCFATGTFACTARGQSLQNQIEKICFLHFSITSYLTQEPISHTMCQSKDEEKKSSAEDGNKDASCWHKNERWHWFMRSAHDIPETITVSSKVFDWDVCSSVCSVFTTLWWRLTDFLMFA